MNDRAGQFIRKRRRKSERVLFFAAREALDRLAADSQDACALISLYEIHLEDLKKAATRWIPGGVEVRAKAINNILAAIAHEAKTYDPKVADAAEWIRECAETEARRLREALNATRQHDRRPGRDL